MRRPRDAHLGTLARRALVDAAPEVFWLDTDDAPDPAPALTGHIDADLAVVGGGFTGLWAALLAKEADPGRDVVVVESGRVGSGATGRNGGFCDASLTHGIANGLRHFPEELPELVRLGRGNLAAIVSTIERYGIDARFEQTGSLTVAAAPHLVPDIAEEHALHDEWGEDSVLLDRDGVRALVDSPLYEGGVWQRSNLGICDPARLAWGLRAAAESLGVRVHERTEVTGVRRSRGGVSLLAESGSVDAARVLLATNAYPGLVPALRRRVVPVWDYVLVTEPLGAEQLRRIGWRERMGVGDAANQFHYYRLTADDRILWGGYDAIYHYGNGLGTDLEQRASTQAMLARHFYETFPQLEDVAFTHRWGGPIATTTRFCVTFGTAHHGRTAFAAGYTGLGVGASRFGAAAGLALLDRAKGRPDPAILSLEFVRSRPMPWPPEPLRWVGIQMTRHALARADRHEGRRGPWLRLLDSFGVGFDS